MNIKSYKTAFVSVLALFTIGLSSAQAQPTKESVKTVTQDNQMIYAWGLAGVLNKMNDSTNFTFAGERYSKTYEKEYRSLLADWWDIKNAAQAKETIQQLATAQMHNPQFKEDMADVFKLNEEEMAKFKNYLMTKASFKTALMYETMWDNRKSLEKNGIPAWDIARAPTVAGWSYLAGYITKEEAYQYSLEIGRNAQKYFHSYKAFADNYTLGYYYWSEDNAEYMQRKVTANMLLSNPRSVWNVFPFDYSMKEIK